MDADLDILAPAPVPGDFHLLGALSGLPVAFALTGAKADEREILLGMLGADPNLRAPIPVRR